MDIVQYLHGLVSTSLGIHNQDVRADLLRQYYALSAARLAGMDTPAGAMLDAQGLWGDQTAPLVSRLARSFHADEAQVLALVQSATPLMMSELHSLAGADRLSSVVGEHFERSRTHLPAWSAMFVSDPSAHHSADTLEATTTAPIMNMSDASADLTPLDADALLADIHQAQHTAVHHDAPSETTPDTTPNMTLDGADLNAFLADGQQRQTPHAPPADGELSAPQHDAWQHDHAATPTEPMSVNTDAPHHDNPYTAPADDTSPYADDVPTDADDVYEYGDGEYDEYNEYDEYTENDDENAEDALANHRTLTKPTARRPSPLVAGAIAGVVALAIGGGVWHFTKKKPEVTHDPSVATPNVQSLNPPRINITTGEHGTLYACRAEVGNSALQTELLRILQQNFGSVDCVMDIKDDYGTSLVGLERLESIIAMMKSDPYTSIEIVGNDIFLNSPNTDVLNRMINDISLLAPQFKISPFAALDRAAAISDGIDKATAALNALAYPPNSDDLARAMSLQVIDFNGTSQLPAQNHAVLALAAQKLSESPETRLIIATHTNTGSDRAANIALATAQATAIRDFLVSQGVSDTQLVVKGVGDALPVADNMTEVGKFKNRRTEFFVYDDATMNALSVDMNQPMSMPMVVEPAPAYQYQYEPQPMPQPMPQGMPAPIGYGQPLSVNPTAAPPMPQYSQPYAPQAMPQPIPQPMPQNMPPPVQSSPPLPNIEYVEVPSEPQIGFITNGQDTIMTAPPAAELPDDIRELSRPIHSEGNRGQSTEIRE